MNLTTFSSENLLSLLFGFIFFLFVLTFLILLFIAVFYMLVLWYRNRAREAESLQSVLLQIAVPRDNEIKIDAAEQLFASLSSFSKSGRFAFLHPRTYLSFEIVARQSDIRFYVHTPKKLQDFVEKQINGAYPDAEIVVASDPSAKQKPEAIVGNEYNIFSENGQVAFASMRLKGN